MDVYDIARVEPSSEIRWSEESLIEAQPWRKNALCVKDDNPDAWFPDKGDRDKIAAAKRVCGRCTARGDCLAYALANDERFGIWGGLDEREIARLRKNTEAPKATHCGRGHEFTTANTRVSTLTLKDGSSRTRRTCVTCERASVNRRAKRKGLAS